MQIDINICKYIKRSATHVQVFYIKLEHSKFYLFYFIKYKNKKKRGRSGFLFPSPPIGVGIGILTPKVSRAHGMKFSLPLKIYK